MLIGVKDSQSDLEKHYKTFCGLYSCLRSQTLYKEKLLQYIDIVGVVHLLSISVQRFCDPLGARTQDPNIKSVVLYLLS